jgi:hypothetical protein
MVRNRAEIVLFDRLPGYSLLRSLTRRLAGRGEDLISRWGSGSNELVAAMRREGGLREVS